jgi:hypothetical protein
MVKPLLKDTQFWPSIEPILLNDFFTHFGLENNLLFQKSRAILLEIGRFRLFVAAKALEFVASVSLGSTISTHNQEDA